MSWNQLLNIFRERRPAPCPPVACPNDGEPLEQGPDGRLHCPFDGWTWPN